MDNTVEITKYGETIDLSTERHTACPVCRKDGGGDKSGDNLYVYGLDENGKHRGCRCFACGWSFPNQEWLEENQEYNWEENKVMGLDFNKDVLVEIKEEYEFIEESYRGIRPETYKYFGVMHRVEDGELVEQIYPTFIGKDIKGFKRRGLPKQFLSSYGETGKDVDFFGQFRFLKSTSRDVLIVGGEVDQMSAFQMLKDYRDRVNKSKGQDFPYTAVVSSTIGENGTANQAQNQYDWLNRFDRIIVCMDNDKAGQDAVDKIFPCVPKGKMYVLDLDLKDSNEYLNQGKEREFIDLFFKARPYTPAGVYASTSLYDAALEYTDLAKLTFPPFLSKMENMFGGGWVKKEICVIFAGTSVGKSIFTNEMTLHWVLNHPEETIGVLSLEATVDKYATSLISAYLGTRLISISDPKEKREYLNLPEIKSKINNLLTRKDGGPSFYVCDDRGAEINVVKEKILEMIIKTGVTTLIIDPFSDLQAGMPLAEQEDFSNWLKKILKEYGITLVLICHTRKSGGSGGEPLTESDIIGSSTIMKSSAQTISLERNKLAEDEFDRNTTKVTIHKNRHFSTTGVAGEIYYDWKTHTLHDKDAWLSEHPEYNSF